MPKQPIILASKMFQSKSDATSFFKSMLNSYRDGDTIESGDDALLFELLQRHPEAVQKIGVGVKRFFRAPSPDHPTSCFHIEREDDSQTDFSYSVSIKGSAPSLDQLFYAACRYSVSEELIRQKQKLFERAGGNLPCAKSGVVVTYDTSDYRHTFPRFREIVAAFRLSRNMGISPNMITHGADLQYVVKFVDEDIEQGFQEFHSANAILDIFKKHGI